MRIENFLTRSLFSVTIANQSLTMNPGAVVVRYNFFLGEEGSFTVNIEVYLSLFNLLLFALQATGAASLATQFYLV